MTYFITKANLNILLQIVSEEHGQNLFGDECMELYFVDFLRDVPETAGDEPDDAELKAPKIYEPIPSLDYLADRLRMFMQQYNETVRGSKMDLVFFKVSLLVIVLIQKVPGLLHLVIHRSCMFLPHCFGDSSEQLGCLYSAHKVILLS